MADEEPPPTPQQNRDHARTLKSLNYGHLGAADYDLESGKWSFVKRNASRRFRQLQIRPNGELLGTCTQLPSIDYPTPRISTNRVSLQEVAKQLARRHPQLAPATSSSADLGLVSAALQNTALTYDPRMGSLLSFGSVKYEGVNIRKTMRIAATATGENGNLLQLALLTKERLEWATDRAVRLEGSSFKKADCGYWNEEAAPIQQICFSQSEDKSTLLAVRLHTRTVILRPTHYRQRQPAKSSPFHHLPSSNIDPYPILSLGIDQTGDSPHVHVVFNPASQYQFGIVNEKQTWSVWDVKRKNLRKDEYTASCKVQGRIIESDDLDSNKDDTWARMLWVCDFHTLLVCNRRHVSIVSIKDKIPVYFSCPPLFGQISADWILDVRHHPKYDNYVLVLTSTHLFLMDIRLPDVHPSTDDDEAGASIIVSWRHYRGQEDITLQLDVHMLSSEECCVLLYSRLNFLVQIYTFREHPSRSAELMSCSDPSMINLKLSGSGHLNQLHMEPMQIIQHKPKLNRMSGSDHSSTDREPVYHRLFATGCDLSIHELVFYTHAGSRLENMVEDFEQSHIQPPPELLFKDETVNEDEDFIVPNGVIEGHNTKSQKGLSNPERGPDPKLRSSHHPLDYKLLYRALIRKESSEERAIEYVDFEVVSSQLDQMLKDTSDNDSFPLGTIMEIAGQKLQLADVDEASNAFQQLLVREQDESAASIQQIASAHVLNLDDGLTMTQLYDEILQHWVACLPRITPIQIRQNREQLARRIAAEVMLASHRIRHIELPEPTVEQQQESSQGSGMPLSILDSRSPSVAAVSSQNLSSSPPSTSIASSSAPPTSQSSLRSVTPREVTSFGDPLVRLNAHLQLKQHSLTPTIIPTTVNEVLAHWELGSDPHAYDWDETERIVRGRSRAASSAPSGKEKRRIERREKRKQRENEKERMASRSLSQASFVDDPLRSQSFSQTPTVIPSMRTQSLSQTPFEGSTRSKSHSQTPGGVPTRSLSRTQPLVVEPMSSPGPALGKMGSSSQIPSSQVAPLSQVEPGRFGGRLERKRKKSRMSGF